YSGGEELERVSSVAASLPERPHSPREAHPSLSSMLVATQASIGLLLIGPLLVPDSLAQSISRLALVLLALGLFASVLHLGRPQLAWRAWMGWRTSWLSREVIAFALFFTALSVEVSL